MYYELNRAAHIARVAVNNSRYRSRNRRKMREFLSASKCADCGTCDFAVLEFDHREVGKKSYEVSRLISNPISWQSVSAEIAKCDVVCANCHRRRTARHFGWRKMLGLESLELPTLPKRGTPEYERIKSMRSRLARQHRNRSLIYDHLSTHSCELCGEGDPVVLDFDHTKDKRREVTLIATFGGWDDLLHEMAKCRVLCANCHRRHTAQQAGRLR